MNTDAIDRLFLELSQFTQATSQKEIRFALAIERAFLAGMSIGNSPKFTMADSQPQWEQYRQTILMKDAAELLKPKGCSNE